MKIDAETNGHNAGLEFFRIRIASAGVYLLLAARRVREDSNGIKRNSRGEREMKGKQENRRGGREREVFLRGSPFGLLEISGPVIY